MKEHIQSKLQWEWDKYVMDMLCTSKQNILTKADEISIKKIICEALEEKIEDGDFNEDEMMMLCSFECIIDEVYAHLPKYRHRFSDERYMIVTYHDVECATEHILKK